MENLIEAGKEIMESREDRFEQGYVYSPALDCLLNYGNARLFQPALLKEEEDCVRGKVARDGVEAFTQSVDEGLKTLKQQLDWAIVFLKSPHTILMDKGAEEGVLALVALEIFDDVAVFSEAIEIEVPYFDAKKYESAADGMLNSCAIDARDYFVRLIPLNERRQLTADLEENNIYLFPWRYEWINVASDALDAIANLIPGTKMTIEEELYMSNGQLMDDGDRNWFFLAVQQDTELVKKIKEDQEFNRIILAAIDRSLCLRIIGQIDNNPGSPQFRLISKEVEDAGLITSASKALEILPGGNLWKAFLAAVSGPGLEDKERISILSEVEKRLEGDTDNPVLLKLKAQKAHTSGKTDAEFALEAWDLWTHTLNEAARIIGPRERKCPDPGFSQQVFALLD